jgi:hypothetical protein
VPNHTDFCTERKGKTVYLLKEGAKPVADNRKRRKISVLALPGQHQQAPQQQQPAEGDEDMQDGTFRDVTPLIKNPASRRNKGQQ